MNPTGNSLTLGIGDEFRHLGMEQGFSRGETDKGHELYG